MECEERAIPKDLHEAARLKEYETLHRNMEQTIEELSKIERWVVVGVASVWAFLATHTAAPALGAKGSPDALNIDKAHLDIAWGIPFLLVLAGAIKCASLFFDFGRTGSYLYHEVEPELGLHWEMHCRSYPRVAPIWGRAITTFVFWCLLICVSWYAFRHHGILAPEDGQKKVRIMRLYEEVCHNVPKPCAALLDHG
jgi:hypothetical protein